MGLIKCPECGKDISDKAEACPDCGYPIKVNQISENNNSSSNSKEKKSKSNILAGLMILIGVPLGAWGAWICFFGMIWAFVELADKDIKKKGLATASVFVFFILMIICAMHAFSMRGSEINKSSESSSSVTQNQEIVVPFGEEYTVGDWKYQIVKVEDTQKIGNGYFSQSTDNNYVVLTLKITNVSTEPLNITTTKTDITSKSATIYAALDYELYDGDSKYFANQDLSGYLDNSFNYLTDKANPNVPITYKVVFETEAKTDEKNYVFRVSSNESIRFNIK